MPCLVDLRTAAAWTGRPEGTLRRWVSEKRLTRYGRARAMLLDLEELRGLEADHPTRLRCPARRPAEESAAAGA